MTAKHYSAADSFIPYTLRFQSSTSEKVNELSPVFTSCIFIGLIGTTAGLIQEVRNIRANTSIAFFFIVMLLHGLFRVLMVLVCAYARLFSKSQALLLFRHLTIIFVLTLLWELTQFRQRHAEEVLLAPATTKRGTWQTFNWQSCSTKKFILNEFQFSLHETSRHDSPN